MVINTQTIVRLRQGRHAYYSRDYPDIMQAIRPEISAFLPLASTSTTYLNELLECEACYRLSDYLERHGQPRLARAVRGLAGSSLFALSAVDSHRGALQNLLLRGQLPRGWKAFQLPCLEVLLPYALKSSDIGRDISKLKALQNRSRLEALRHWVRSARRFRAGVYSYNERVSLEALY